jgi:trimethylamine--corrinoid protein Co-methyltransferase
MRSTVLTDSQIQTVNAKSLEILRRVGVVVPHPEMLRRFADAGAGVDFQAQRVRIPETLVTKLVAGAGKKFTLYGRTETKKAEFGVGKRNFNSIAGEAMWVDAPGGQRRFPSLKDVADATRCADALEELTIPGAMADPHELPVEYRCVSVMAEMLKNTDKPFMFWFHDRASAKFLVDMVIAVRGSEKKAADMPLCYPFLEPISPLRFPFNGVDLLFETARINMPVPIGPMAQMGVSAPATLAGTLAIENAEILAGVCITQLVKPGLPVCYGGICHAFDMHTTQMIFCGPEQALFGVAMTQIGKSHGLPVYINVGLSDSKRPDAQAGIEVGITLMLGAAAGADIFGHMGISGVDQATSLDMLIMQHEAIRYVNSVMRDMDLSDDAFAVDVIEERGPGGSFLETEHTVSHFRKELWFPQLLDRQYYQGWLDSGAKSMEDRCRAKKEAILKTHTPVPMVPDLEREIDRVAAAAKKALTK